MARVAHALLGKTPLVLGSPTWEGALRVLLGAQCMRHPACGVSNPGL